MKTIALCPFLLVFICACEQDVTPAHPFLLAEEPERFVVDYIRDTVLETQNGTTITISAGTFSIHKDGLVEVEIREIRTKAQMIRQRMSTITATGEILETGGMIYFGLQPEQPLNNPVRVALSTEGIIPRMRRFVGIQNEDGVTVWQNGNPLANQDMQQEVLRGEALYEEHCLSCHSADLRTRVTGPALGNVHLYRDLDWFIRFTQNSQKMIAEGDDLATCLWWEWGPTVMSSFEDTLNTEEISSIYRYIANQSLLDGIDSTEIRYPLRMERDTLFDPDREPDEHQDFEVDQICYSNQETMVFRARDNTVGSNFLSVDRYLEYAFDIKTPNWYNVDRFIYEGLDGVDLIDIRDIELEISSKVELEYLYPLLVYPDHDIVVFFKSVGKNRFRLNPSTENIRLPNGPASIVAIAFVGEDSFLGTIPLELPTKLNYELKVEKINETTLKTFLEKLD